MPQSPAEPFVPTDVTGMLWPYKIHDSFHGNKKRVIFVFNPKGVNTVSNKHYDSDSFGLVRMSRNVQNRCNRGIVFVVVSPSNPSLLHRVLPYMTSITEIEGFSG